ncbi:MAG: NlpC/P60 family protein [Pseudomonadota bacterium]
MISNVHAVKTRTFQLSDQLKIMENGTPMECTTNKSMYVATLAIVSLFGLVECQSTGKYSSSRSAEPPCLREVAAPPVLPYERQIYSVADFWLEKDLWADHLLLTSEQITEHNQRMEGLLEDGWPTGRWDLRKRPVEHESIYKELLSQMVHFREDVAQGKKLHADGIKAVEVPALLENEIKHTGPVDEFRLIYRSTPLRCYPTNKGIYDDVWQTAFDLMQCSQLRVGEMVRVLRRGNNWWYAWSSYSGGWIVPGGLTPPLSPEEVQNFLDAKRFIVTTHDNVPIWSAPKGGNLLTVTRLGVRLPLLAETKTALQVSIPSERGITEGWIQTPEQVTVGYLPFTRRYLTQIAFRQFNSRYGWGGIGGNRDCSRMLMDIFSPFGLLLPRNSARQAQAGWISMDVADLNEEEKEQAIEEAFKKGAVLLYMPGHIMLYVGKDNGHLYALHSFSGYLVPCPKGGETMNRVNRTAVTSLELGRGSSRKAFIERITRLIIFGAYPLTNERNS